MRFSQAGCVVLIGLAWTCPALQATQTDNFGLHAVPAPGKVAIDGKLDDWDLSGEIFVCYDIEKLEGTNSARIVAMYDADNLYVAIRWKDPTPMGNIHDPRYRADKGWAGDAVQLRVKTDRIAHITAWYYAAEKEPVMQIDYGVGMSKPFGGGHKALLRTEGWKLSDGAEMAFLADADGKGYVQEMKIPWKLIVQDATYGAGDAFNMGIELMWGEGDWPTHRYADNLAEGTTGREFFFTDINNWGKVFLEPKGGLRLPEPAYMKAYRKAQAGVMPQGPVEISYELPQAARVTLAVDDKQGHRVRNLVPALPRPAGKNTERWDGLDDDGKPVEPGEYAYKLIYHDDIHVRYVMSFANPGNPTWETSDGKGGFYGDHTAPQGAAAAGDYVALATPMGEGGKHLIGLSLEGQRLWGLPNRSAFDGGRISLATDGKVLWVGNEGKESTVYRVDIATGRYAPWAQTAKDASGQETPVLDLKVSEAPGMAGAEHPPVNLVAIALGGGELGVCLQRENLLKILDAGTGRTKAQLPVEAPAAVVRAGTGWIVLSRGRLLRYGAAGTGAAFTPELFPDGYALASDAAGNVYLSVRGDDQNVKVFSPAGKRLREIGAKGGRPLQGPYRPDAMRNPAQIAIDGRGRLWVAEETKNPKRTSLWNAATGALVRDFAGTTAYAAAGSINPFDPTMAFSNDTVYRIDLDKGTSRPVYSTGPGGNPDEIFPPAVHSTVASKTVLYEGKTYVFSPGAGPSSVDCTLWDGTNWRAVASVGQVPNAAPGKMPRHWGRFLHPLFQQHGGQFYSWADANGDGLVQADELRFAPAALDGSPAETFSYYWGALPDDAGTVAMMVRKKPVLFRFPIASVTPAGAPIYDVAKPEIVRADRDLLGGGNGEGMVAGGGSGRFYLNQDPLVAVEKDGHVVDGYPNKFISVHGSHRASAARPGYLIGPSQIFGTADLGPEIGEVFYLGGNLGEDYLFTNDILYVQTLFKDTRGLFQMPSQAAKGMSMDETTAGGESFGGNFLRTADGKCYVVRGGTDARVMEITGLDSIRRLQGKFVYGKNQYLAAQKQFQQKAVEASVEKVYRAAKATAPIEIDGKPDEWPELADAAQAVQEIQDDDVKPFGRVQVRYDADNLYVAWRVLTGRPQMRNGGQDYRLLFKTGDAVDFMLGPEPQAPHGEGNLRLLVSQMGGKPVAILNVKNDPGAAKGAGFEFASPWRSIAFDRVAQVPEARAAVGKIAGGYFVEAAVPWSVLGVTPRSGLKLRWDVGVLFGDDGGTQTVARHYWSNKATNLVNDVPGEADLAPQIWGVLELE